MRDPQVIHTAIDAALGNGYRLIGEELLHYFLTVVCTRAFFLVVLLKSGLLCPKLCCFIFVRILLT